MELYKTNLENDFVLLEVLAEKHFEAFLEISNRHPNLLQYSASNFGTEELLKEYFELALNNRFAFAKIDKQNQKVVGSTSLGNYSPANKRVQIGWSWLAPEAQGTGINKQCKFLLLQFCFDKCDIERVEFTVDPRNSASIKALQKIGAQLEGELRSHILMQDGSRRNSQIYSILKEDWPQLKSSVFKGYKSTRKPL